MKMKRQDKRYKEKNTPQIRKDTPKAQNAQIILPLQNIVEQNALGMLLGIVRLLHKIVRARS